MDMARGGKFLGKARTAITVAAMAGTLASAAVMLGPDLPAFAETPTPAASTPSTAAVGRPYVKDPLERLFQRELRILANEQKALNQANTVVDKVQQYINNQNAKGEDTTKLAEALANFKAAVGKAQADHTTAKSILDAHAGFGANGEVVDIAQARHTVLTAGKAERQFHQTLRQARTKLHNALREYRRSHQGDANGAGSLPS